MTKYVFDPTQPGSVRPVPEGTFEANPATGAPPPTVTGAKDGTVGPQQNYGAPIKMPDGTYRYPANYTASQGVQAIAGANAYGINAQDGVVNNPYAQTRSAVPPGWGQNAQGMWVNKNLPESQQVPFFAPPSIPTSIGADGTYHYDDNLAPGTKVAPGAGGGGGGAGGAGGTSPATGVAGLTDAQAIIGNLLDSYGLGSLKDWAYSLVTQGATPAMIDLQLRERPEFKARFPGIALRQAKGLPPISPGSYVAYEKSALEAFRQAGLPDDFYSTTNHLANFIANDISMAELQDRVRNGYQAAMQAPVEFRNQLQSLYGIDSGHLAAFFLDPAQAEPLIMRKFAAAKIGGEAALTGYRNPLSATTLEGLAAQGVTDQRAAQGFSKLGHESQLFGALPGQSGEQNIAQNVQLGAEFAGNADDQKIIQDQANGRIAQFAGGGGYAGSNTGVSGLGSSST